MASDARVGIELPSRVLVWQEADGTRLGYRDPRALSEAYDLAGHEETLERMSSLLAALVAAAAGEPANPAA